MKKQALIAFLLVVSVAETGHAQTLPAFCAVSTTTRPSLPARLLDGIGRVDYPITTASAEAQIFFNQGMALLHSFWFGEAERSFMQAAALDPDAAMAYWGIAMSAQALFRPAYQLLLLPPTQPSRIPVPDSPEGRARDAVNKALQLRDKVTARERRHIDAVAARHNPRSTRAERDFVQGYRDLVKTYPDDVEAKAILAMFLQSGWDPVSREPREGMTESIELLREVLGKDPDHPGALHFLIHVYEDSPRPELAWEACERYPKVAPNAPHALHMPGHIYIQSGRSADAARAFEADGAKEREYMAKDALYPTAHYVHNQNYLSLALALQGRYRDAVATARQLFETPENPRERADPLGSGARRQGWYAIMRAMVRFERFDEVLDPQQLPAPTSIPETAWFQWARATTLLQKRQEANASIREFEQALNAARQAMGALPPELLAARREIEGLAEFRKGNTRAGLETLLKASQMQREILYTEPPSYPRPVDELIGKLALEVRDFAAAEQAYRRVLQRQPDYGRAVWGLAQVLLGAGKDEEADKRVKEFRKVWANADSDLPEVIAAKSNR